MSSRSVFEILPDEILLEICRYLHGADVLYSFYNLNTRLNVTITDYYHYVDFSGVNYHRFDHVASHILPQISSFVRSFTFHGYREKLLSPQAYTFFYHSPISSTFPRLQTLTLSWFTGKTLSSFIDVIQDLPHLIELNIRFLQQVDDETLLTKIFATNHGRLESVSFDQDSAYLDIPIVDKTILYVNIQKLKINITESEMLSYIFTLVPSIQRLHVTIESSSSKTKFKENFINQSPLIHLIEFHLYLVNVFWDFEEIDIVLRQMPSLQTLTLNLYTRDERLIKPEVFRTILPSTIKQTQFLIRYYFDEMMFEVHSLVTSWSIFFPIHCLLDNKNNRLVMFTDSMTLPFLSLPATISKQIQGECKYIQGVSKLHVYNPTSLTDILLTVQHFHRLRKLSINTENISDMPLLTPLQQAPTLDLPQLKHLDVSGLCPILDILKAAPNLDDLLIDFDTLNMLLDDQVTCDLLQQRIIRLDVRYWIGTESDLLQRVSRIFSRLRHLCLNLNNAAMLTHSILSTILTHSNLQQLYTLIIGCTIPDEINENLRQCVMDHTYLTENDSFTVNYINNFFILWK